MGCLCSIGSRTIVSQTNYSSDQNLYLVTLVRDIVFSLIVIAPEIIYDYRR